MSNTLESAAGTKKSPDIRGKVVKQVNRETQDCIAKRAKKQIHLSNE
ncbi:hypothetical protein [Paraburkholderia youngii]